MAWVRDMPAMYEQPSGARPCTMWASFGRKYLQQGQLMLRYQGDGRSEVTGDAGSAIKSLGVHWLLSPLQTMTHRAQGLDVLPDVSLPKVPCLCRVLLPFFHHHNPAIALTFIIATVFIKSIISASCAVSSLRLHCSIDSHVA